MVAAGDYSIEVESAVLDYDVLFGKSVSTFSETSNKCILRICNVSEKKMEIPAGVRLVNAVQVTVPDSEFQQLLFRTARINIILTDVKIYTKNPEKKLQAETLIRRLRVGGDVENADDEL